MKSNNFFRIALSVFVSFVFVFAVTYAATTISTSISTGGTLSVTDTSTLTGAVTVGGGYGDTGVTLSAAGAISADGLATLAGGATTTSITLLNGEVISNATDGVVQMNGIASSTSVTLLNGETITNATDGTITLTAATTSLTGLGLMANGFLSQASSTVVGNLTVTGTFSPTQTAATSFLVGDGYGNTGVTLSAAGAISADGLATLAGGATTTILTLLNGEIISNGTDGVIQLGGVASTTSITLLNGETITNVTDGTIALTGALTVSDVSSFTGLATLLGGATTTILTLLNGEIISNATDGVIQLGGIASTTSLTLLNGETITNATDGVVQVTATTLKLIGTASTSAIKVGDEPAAPTIEGMVFGYCSFGDVTSFTASTTKYADCTTVPAGALLAGDRVFVQATSSFDSMFVITAASTTGVSTINLRILNTGLDGAADPTLGGTSINFWAVR